MNMRFLISVVVVFIVSMVLDFVVHGLLLGADYQKLVPGLFRAPEDGQAHFGWMLLAHVFIAVGLTWIYRAGRDERPWLGQGLRFGIGLAILTTIPTYLIYYAVQPMPFDMVMKQIAFSTIAILVVAVVAAAVNSDPLHAQADEPEEDLSPMPR